jgi:hypothetical protein
LKLNFRSNPNQPPFLLFKAKSLQPGNKKPHCCAVRSSYTPYN